MTINLWPSHLALFGSIGTRYGVINTDDNIKTAVNKLCDAYELIFHQLKLENVLTIMLACSYHA